MKTIQIVICSLAVLVLSICKVQAQDYGYTINIDNTITIDDGWNFNGTIIIPNMIDGLPVTVIGEQAFSDCNYTNYFLTGVTIPNSVTNIGNWAFRYCLSLIDITVDSSNLIYSSLDGVLFNKDQSIIIQYPGGKIGNFTISLNVTNIVDMAFHGSFNLTDILVDTNNLVYSSIDGVLFNKDQTMIIVYPEGKTGTNYRIPNSVINIEHAAFIECTNLTNVIIPDSATNIGNWAFLGSGLTNVIIGNGVISIGVDAFDSCASLISVIISDSVRNINHGAFDFCDNLTNVIIGNGVTDIGTCVFDSDFSLISITVGNSVTNIGFGTFDCGNLKEIYFKGNVPILNTISNENGIFGPFCFDTNLTIYYLPGTTGWSTNCNGRPTALWLPKISDNSNFGIHSNQFGFNINWASGMVYVVQACTNLSTASWHVVQSNTLNSDTIFFSDSNWTNNSHCFYRIKGY